MWVSPTGGGCECVGKKSGGMLYGCAYHVLTRRCHCLWKWALGTTLLWETIVQDREKCAKFETKGEMDELA